jgi:spermidine synthase
VSPSSHELLLTIGWARDRSLATTNADRIRRALWMSTPFFTGAVIMAQELVAFRLYAPYFGYSIYVWGSMISVVMAALAAGYALGGWVADRTQSDLVLYFTILGSALYQLGILFTVHSLLRALTHMGDFTGVLLASLIIFVPPMTAMATACPFLIRLLANSGHVGSAAGKIYAISTVGSIAGVLVTSFFLVPHLGTQKTLTVICLLSAAAAAAGLALHTRTVLLALGLIGVLLPLVPSPTSTPNTLWAADSPYNLVRVVRNGEWLLLKLNEEAGVHTIRNERAALTGHYYDEFALGPLLTPAKRLLVLGLGGGGSIASTRITAPEIEIDAVEIDPKVVEAAVRFFGVNPQDGRLRIHVADARPWLAQNRSRYDLVHVDLYQGGPYIPFYLVTREFFEAVRAHISANGLLMMNLFDTGRGQELLISTVATLKQVFPSVMVLSVGSHNRMLLAFCEESSEASVRARLESFRGDQTIQRLAKRAESQVTALQVPDGTVVFTDDFAPVEEMTRRMLKRD